MYVYVTTNNAGAFTVGFYVPTTGLFVVESTHDSADAAAARVSYLNGGPEPT